MSETTINRSDLLKITGDICSAYVSNNNVSLEDLGVVISKVFYSLSEINRYGSHGRHTGPLVPAVPIEESVQEDYIVCLEDGKKLQMLKRHLKTVYNMTVDQYMEKWGLPWDYPRVAPNYAKLRSQIAKETGLGVNGRRKRSSANLKLGLIDTKDASGISQVAVMAKK